MKVFGILLAVLGIALHSGASAESIEVPLVSRRIDATTARVFVVDEIDFKNAGSSAVSSVQICSRDPKVGSLAFFRATEGAYKRASKPLTTSPGVKSKVKGVTCYTVDLPSPLAPGATTKVGVYTVYVRQLVPFPANITQAETPKVILQLDAVLPSPYAVKKQSSTLKTPTNNFDSYGEDDESLAPVSKSASAGVTFGPYSDVPAFASKPFTAHFEFLKPIARITKLVREITISPWGNIYVEEQYDVTNDAPRLSGEFSRLRHMVSSSKVPGMPGGVLSGKSAIDSLLIRLPRDARWPYYRDDIGNISSSYTRQKTTEVEINLTPRFPIYGGWRSVFLFGYSLPFKGYLTRNTNGVQRLRLQFGCPMPEGVVDDYELRVVFPEGSTPLTPDAVSSPHGAAVGQDSKTTYFDLKARPVLVFRKSDLVHDHNTYIHLDYRYPGYRLLQTPATIVAAVALILGTASLASRLSQLSISSGDEGVKARQRKEKVEALAADLADAAGLVLKVLESYESDLRGLVENRDAALAIVKARRPIVEAQKGKAFDAVQAALQPLATVDSVSYQAAEGLIKQLKGVVSQAAESVRAAAEDGGASDAVRVGRALLEVEKGRRATREGLDALTGGSD